jgi:polyferredoxin
MSHVIWLLVLVGFLVILGSLGSALFQLSRGTPEASARLLRALTVRITVSLLLFALLMLAWYFGLISPHGLQGTPVARP